MLDLDERIERVVENLKSDLKFSNKIEHIEYISPEEGTYGYLHDLNPKLIKYLEKKRIKLYKHQVQVSNLLKEGKNVIITTPTSSGKTLAFTLPVLEAFDHDSGATALYLYPAKALSSDQLKTLHEYEKETGITLNPYKYDGDTPKERRKLIRQKAKILITNPYLLHSILFFHYQWCRFYSNLKFIIIDEAHTYRGVFGSEVAFLIRRLLRICNYYGSNPRLILSSATLANPVEFSEKLTGKKVSLVEKDYSSRGKKTIVFFNPFNENEASSTFDTRDVVSMLVSNDIQTLCFTRTRHLAETITNKIRNYLKESNSSLLSESITPYRAQYGVTQRREIEEGFRNRDHMGVISTNALELGIDIGSLDAVVISGYPGTLMSMWQQAGRAGRGTKSSLAILIATHDPLNQYIIQNQEYVLKSKHENATVDLKNETILFNHIKSAASELPLNKNDLELFDINESLIDENKELNLLKDPLGWKYIKLDENLFPESHAHNNPIKEISKQKFRIIHENKCIELLNTEDAYLLAFEGAYHQYSGDTYLVDRVELEHKKIFVKIKNEDYNKNSEKRINLTVQEKIKSVKKGLLDIHYGKLDINIDFYKFEYKFGKKINYEPINVPSLKLKTRGLWFDIPDNIKNNLINYSSDPDILRYSINGAETILLNMFPLHILCDKCDIGIFTAHYKENSRVFIYDSYRGGIGLSEKAIDIFSELTRLALDMVKKCKCENGCINCIYASTCGLNFKRRDKKGAIILLTNLLESIDGLKNKVSLIIKEPVHHEIADIQQNKNKLYSGYLSEMYYYQSIVDDYELSPDRLTLSDSKIE